LIIERIVARDFMRFRSLDIRGVPESGAIAVVGPNESGKSAIGEAICFALFGETPRASLDKAFRVIRWGAPSVRVELRFEVPGAGRYAVVREMDREGGLHAVLKPVDADVVLAEGVENVRKELTNLLGFRFDEFRYSFYLAQNELDLLDVGTEPATRRVIYKMLGLDVLEKASRRTRAELETLSRSFRADRSELRLSQALLDSSGFDPDEARSLHEEIGRLKEEEEGRKNLANELRTSLELHEKTHKASLAFQGILPALRSAIRRSFLGEALLKTADRIGGHLKARIDEKRREEEDLASHAEATEETAGFAEALGRLLDMARIRAAHLKRNLALHEEGEERDVSRMEELEEVRARLKTDRHARWRAGVQFFFSLAVTVLCGVALYGFENREEFIRPLSEAISEEVRMPLTLGVGGFFLLLSLLFTYRLVTTGRSLAHNRRFRDRLEVEVTSMQKESEALDGLLAGGSWTLKSVLPFLRDEDLRAQGQVLLDRHASRASQGVNEASLESVRRDLGEAKTKLERRETEARRRSALVALLKRKGTELVKGRPEARERAESAFALPPAQDLDALEEEVQHMLDEGIEQRNLLVTEDQEAGNDESGTIEALVEDGEILGNDLLDLAKLATGHGGTFDYARFREFVSGLDPERSPGAVFSTLEEELARLRSAFPANEELERRREKILYDLEQEMAKLAALSARIEGLERESRRLVPQMASHSELVTKVDLLESRLEPMEHDIAVRRALIELLAGTVTNVKNRFGPAVGRFVGSILPMITKERYGKVRVSADLDISVFSRERNDFTDLEELSGGTRDQVLVCLRLALAQAMLHSRRGGDRRQFLFLDEPISSFDEERSLLFLDLIKEFSENFQQTFVTIHMVNAVPRAWAAVVQTHAEEDRLDADLA